MDAVEFWSICSMNGLLLSQEQMEDFKRYAGDLEYWNGRINLISRRDVEHIWLKHILHCTALCFTGLLPKSGKVLDIGTGGGLPGIPLKIANPKLDITLLDSIAKKAQTVGMLASHITKHGLRAIRNRAEALGDDPKNHHTYDLVVSRAAAPLVDLVKWSEPLLVPGGYILALKGGELTEEIRQAQVKFPDVTITVHELRVIGTDWFSTEQKKVVEVRWSAG